MHCVLTSLRSPKKIVLVQNAPSLATHSPHVEQPSVTGITLPRNTFQQTNRPICARVPDFSARLESSGNSTAVHG